MKDYGVLEYILDRHDLDAWQKLPKEDYDAVIDLCAYQKGDIQTVIQSFPRQIRHYILISTVDVYQRLVHGGPGALRGPGLCGVCHVGGPGVEGQPLRQGQVKRCGRCCAGFALSLGAFAG